MTNLMLLPTIEGFLLIPTATSNVPTPIIPQGPTSVTGNSNITMAVPTV